MGLSLGSESEWGGEQKRERGNWAQRRFFDSSGAGQCEKCSPMELDTAHQLDRSSLLLSDNSLSSPSKPLSSRKACLNRNRIRLGATHRLKVHQEGRNLKVSFCTVCGALISNSTGDKVKDDEES